MTKNISVLLMPAFLTYNSSLIAGDYTALPTVNVAATHIYDTPLSVKNSLISISSEDIKQQNPQSIVDLLNQIGGVTANQSGGAGGRTYISIRGGDPNFTLILIDGVRFNNPTDNSGGSVDLSMIDPALIERIDIFPSGISSIHGSGTLSGIIHIITKSNIDEKDLIGISLGSDLSKKGFFKTAGTIYGSDNTWSLSGSHQRKATSVTKDTLSNRNLSGSLDYNITDNALLGANFAITDGTASAFPEDSGGPRLAVYQTPETRRLTNVSGSVKLESVLNNNWLLNAELSAFKSTNHLDNPGVPAGILSAVPPHSSATKYSYNSLNFSLLRKYSSNYVSIGGEYKTEHGKSQETIILGFPLLTQYNIDRYTAGLYGELSSQLSDELSMDISLRHEMSSSESTINLFRFATAYQIPNSSNTIQASWSEGYKLPSLFAIGSGLVGNPNLKSETSNTTEIRYLNKLPYWNIETNIAVYRSNYENLIDFDTTTFSMVNRNKVEVSGGELSITAKPISKLSLSSNVSYSDAVVINDQSKLRRRPIITGNVSAQWNRSKYSQFRLDANYTGDYFDSSVPTGMIEMPAYWTIDLSSNWKLSNNVNVRLKIRNIFDETYEESIGFSNAGRQAFLTITAQI